MTDGRNWDICNVSGTTGQLTVGTSAVEVKVGASRLDGRQFVRLYNDSGNRLYWSFLNTVTTSGATRGEIIEKNASIEWNIGSQVPVYVIAGSAGNTVVISEAS